MKVKILYYDWNEFTGQDCRMALEELGHEVIPFHYDWNRLNEDPGFEAALRKELGDAERSGKPYTCAFSFNFFPVVSAACERMGMRYISWIFDSPHLPLTSCMVKNRVNRIWVFDRAMYLQMRAEGISTVFYSPLGVNSTRLRSVVKKLDEMPVYEHEVSFLGSLYDNEYNFYDQAAEYLPEYLRGYLEGVFTAQQQIFGTDLIGEESVLPAEKVRELNRYMKFALSGSYRMNLDQVIRDILRKKVTQEERRKLLERFGKCCKLDLYTQEYSPVIENVYDLGRADYMEKMPRVFHRSKINLNFTMRSIRSGIPLRALDIMAAGGFLLTGYQQELDEYFVNGQELVMAGSPEEMQELIGYYLAHDSEREKIARKGKEKTLKQFDYHIRVRKMIKESE